MIREEIPIDDIQFVLANEAKCILRQGNLEVEGASLPICEDHDCAHCDLLLPDKLIIRCYEAVIQHLDVIKAQGYENLLATIPESDEDLQELIGGDDL